MTHAIGRIDFKSFTKRLQAAALSADKGNCRLPMVKQSCGFGIGQPVRCIRCRREANR